LPFYDRESNLLKNKRFSEISFLFKDNSLDSMINRAIHWNTNNTDENPLSVAIPENSIPDEKVLYLPLALELFDSSLLEKYTVVLYRFAVTIVKADGVQNDLETIKLKEIYKQLTHNSDKPNITSALKKEKEKSKNININKPKNTGLDNIITELNELVGLDTVKKEVNTLINFINIQNERKKQDLPTQTISYHIVFTGNPGTGKTTVARIVSQIYKHLGILKTGSLIETDRAGLIGEYVGHTAIKVNKVVDGALNNVLFIDEAYSLNSEDSYSKEAVATLIKRMEDDRDKLVLIIAGYKNEMNTFIETNPGIKSRFNRYIEFEDYTPNELYKIFESQCQRLKYKLAVEAENKLRNLFENAYQNRDKHFGNGRFVRNIFEKTIEKQSNRIASEPEINKDILITITAEDIL
jgi:AAA+ superfamily predicted ATPase